MLDKNSHEAKKDERLHTSGNVIAFRLENSEFSIRPTTFFYDWLYINAIYQNKKLADQLLDYTAFTDIAFNPAKSLNCQARSAALYVSLVQQGMLKDALSSAESFLALVYDPVAEETIGTHTEQLSLFDL